MRVILLSRLPHIDAHKKHLSTRRAGSKSRSKGYLSDGMWLLVADGFDQARGTVAAAVTITNTKCRHHAAAAITHSKTSTGSPTSEPSRCDDERESQAKPCSRALYRASEGMGNHMRVGMDSPHSPQPSFSPQARPAKVPVHRGGPGQCVVFFICLESPKMRNPP